MTWKRNGECCRCGECCRGDPWNDQEVVEKYGPRPRDAYAGGLCPLLDLHIGAPQGDSTCIGHIGAAIPGQENGYYLASCANWPTDPVQIEGCPSCTYSFEWVDDK